MINEDIKIEMTLEELKVQKEKYEKESQDSLKSILKLNNVLMRKLEMGPAFPQVSEKTKKLQELFLKLSALLNEKQELSKEIQAKHEALKLLYFEHKQAMAEIDNKPVTLDADTNSTTTLPIRERELLEIQAERDKALGLAKVLLATLKSSRMQSEENFHKLKYSADLMFHILYKAEDAFLCGVDENNE